MAGIEAESSRCGIGKLPSLALDSGIHAGMTGFGAKLRIAGPMLSKRINPLIRVLEVRCRQHADLSGFDGLREGRKTGIFCADPLLFIATFSRGWRKPDGHRSSLAALARIKPARALSQTETAAGKPSAPKPAAARPSAPRHPL